VASQTWCGGEFAGDVRGASSVISRAGAYRSRKPLLLLDHARNCASAEGSISSPRLCSAGGLRDFCIKRRAHDRVHLALMLCPFFLAAKKHNLIRIVFEQGSVDKADFCLGHFGCENSEARFLGHKNIVSKAPLAG
jgi:hypothetical protein